jgi:hypothetical protein
MKKILSALIVGIIILSCGNSGVDPEVNVVNQQPKIEVKKDYDYYLKRIAEDEEWMLSIESKAKELGISIDEELRKNAKHMAKQNGFDQEAKDYDYYLKRISGDPIWMIDINNQAEDKGISVDSALNSNARHMAKEVK